MAEIYPEILHFLESAGFRKSARKFCKESKCISPAKYPVDLENIIRQAQREIRKKRKANAKQKKLASSKPDIDLEESIKAKVAQIEAVTSIINKSESKKRKKVSSLPSSPPQTHEEIGISNKRARRSEAPFRRIDESKWTKDLNSRLNDQSYWAKGGDSFAVKAAEDLGKVRGKDFRREMQKKKRASWKGAGEIDLGVNSIQFSDSD